MRKRVGVLYDLPESYPTTSIGHSLSSDSFPLEMVKSLADLVRDCECDPIEIPGTAHLLGIVAARLSHLIQGCLNLSSGTPAGYRLGHAPILLEMLGIPYSGSDPFTMLLCRDKYRCKSVLESELRTPPGIFLTPSSLHMLDGISDSIYPLIVKPNSEGSSIGISKDLISSSRALRESVAGILRDHPEGVLVERFIAGIEVTVMVLGVYPKIDPTILVMTRSDGSLPSPDLLLDYDTKLTILRDGIFQWELADNYLPKDTVNVLLEWTRTASRLLSLRDLARLDFRIDASNTPYFIECNGLPVLEKGFSTVARLNTLKYGEDRGFERAFVTKALSRMGLLPDQ